MGVVKTLKSIREFFWPLLDPLDEVSIRQITIEDCKFNDDEIDMELKYLEDNKRSEEDRKKEVESKATIFIGTFAVATTVLINMAKEFIFSPILQTESLNYAVVLLIALTIIYLCRAINAFPQTEPLVCPEEAQAFFAGQSFTGVAADGEDVYKRQSKVRSFFSRTFYKLSNKITDVKMPYGAVDFRIMSRQMLSLIHI